MSDRQRKLCVPGDEQKKVSVWLCMAILLCLRSAAKGQSCVASNYAEKQSNDLEKKGSLNSSAQGIGKFYQACT